MSSSAFDCILSSGHKRTLRQPWHPRSLSGYPRWFWNLRTHVTLISSACFMSPLHWASYSAIWVLTMFFDLGIAKVDVIAVVVDQLHCVATMSRLFHWLTVKNFSVIPLTTIADKPTWTVVCCASPVSCQATTTETAKRTPMSVTLWASRNRCKMMRVRAGTTGCPKARIEVQPF